MLLATPTHLGPGALSGEWAGVPRPGDTAPFAVHAPG